MLGEEAKAGAGSEVPSAVILTASEGGSMPGGTAKGSMSETTVVGSTVASEAVFWENVGSAKVSKMGGPKEGTSPIADPNVLPMGPMTVKAFARSLMSDEVGNPEAVKRSSAMSESMPVERSEESTSVTVRSDAVL
jgi:hypothetical protein